MQLVIDSKFRPFSYDELIKPLMQYKEAYDKVEADYSNLAAQTEQWKDIANQTQSPEAYAMYSKYANDLNKLVDDFSKGMTLQNRSQLLAMKRRYASDIQPIARASEAMKEANDLRVKAGPDAIFEVGEYNSLDQFLHGRTANNRYQSRDAITKRTAAMTEAAMASAMKDPEFQKAMGDQYWMLTQHTGGSYEDLKAAIANNAQAQNRFAEIKAQVMKDAGYDRYDTMGKQAIEDAINTGLYAGLDKPARSFQANQSYMNPLQKLQYNEYVKKEKEERAKHEPISLGEPYGTYEEYYDPDKKMVFHLNGKGKREYRFLTEDEKKGLGFSERTAGVGGSKGTNKVNRLQKAIKIRVEGTQGGYIEGYDVEPKGEKIDYFSLKDDDPVKRVIDSHLGDDIPDGYEIYVEKPGWGHTHDRVYMVPKSVETYNQEEVDPDVH